MVQMHLKFVFFVTSRVRRIWPWNFIYRWCNLRSTFMIFFQNFLKLCLVGLHGFARGPWFAPDTFPCKNSCPLSASFGSPAYSSSQNKQYWISQNQLAFYQPNWISRHAISICGNPHELCQTIYWYENILRLIHGMVLWNELSNWEYLLTIHFPFQNHFEFQI